MMTKNEEMNVGLTYVGMGYTLNTAVKLMHREVIRARDTDQPRTLENTGLVSGILHLNEEIELVVQFYDHIEQFTQEEFEAQLTVLADDC